LIVSYRVLYIRPCEQSFSPRTKPACKYGPRSVEEEQLPQRGSLFISGRVRSLYATSLPLPPASSQDSQTACSSGAQNGFHRQVAANPNKSQNNIITHTYNVIRLRALLSILYIARFLGFEGFFPNYCDFSATEPISSLFRDKALAL